MSTCEFRPCTSLGTHTRYLPLRGVETVSPSVHLCSKHLASMEADPDYRGQLLTEPQRRPLVAIAARPKPPPPAPAPAPPPPPVEPPPRADGRPSCRVPGCGRLHQARGLCARHRDEAGALIRKLGLQGAEYDQALDQTIGDLIAGRTIPGQKPKRTPKPKPAPPPVADRHDEPEPDPDQAAKLANLTTSPTNESTMPATPINPSASPDGPNDPAPTLTPAEDASDPNAGPVGGTGGLPGDGGVELEPPAGEEVEAPRFTLHHAPYLTPSDAEPPTPFGEATASGKSSWPAEPKPPHQWGEPEGPPPVLPEHRGIAEQDAADRDGLPPRYDEDTDAWELEETPAPPPEPVEAQSVAVTIPLPVTLEWEPAGRTMFILFVSVEGLPGHIRAATVRRVGRGVFSAELVWHNMQRIDIPWGPAPATLRAVEALLGTMGLPTIPPCPLAAEPAAD